MKDAGADAETLANGVKQIVDRYLNGVPQLDVVCDSNMLLKLTVSDTARHWMGRDRRRRVSSRTQGATSSRSTRSWYNALKTAEQLTGDKQYGEAAEKCAKSFNDTFWSFDMNGLYRLRRSRDLQDRQLHQARTRYSRRRCPTARFRPRPAQKVVRLCWNELYTTYGLRTLDPRHDKFKGRFEGRLDQRIKACYPRHGVALAPRPVHNGLPEIQPDEEGPSAGRSSRPFNSHLRHGCLGGVAQLFDGMMPYPPRTETCSAPRLSGELLRVLHEDPRNGSVNFSQSFSFKPPSAV